ncbi:MAG TPA: GntR family transcriptional regulator [Terriglobales bacterium]|nr:GntR family transcriptional regulator [Terriglobales bacterium]
MLHKAGNAPKFIEIIASPTFFRSFKATKSDSWILRFASLYTKYTTLQELDQVKEIVTDLFRPERVDVRTIKEQVVDLLRNAILSGKINTGERLNESVLARDLGLSRIPVREALQKLQEQGLVVDAPRRGKFVVNLNDEEIQKINSVRLILEGEALRLCRAKMSAEGLSDLKKLVDKMDHSLEASEVDASALDIEFHRTLWRHSGNEYLSKMLESITIPLFAHRVLWRLNREMLGWASNLPNRHRLLIEFVEGKINKPAEEVMLDHLSYRYDHPERFSSLALAQNNFRAIDPVKNPLDE